MRDMVRATRTRHAAGNAKAEDACGGLVIAKVIGYYGLVGAAGLSALFLH
jgi:hypothetical protein